MSASNCSSHYLGKVGGLGLASRGGGPECIWVKVRGEGHRGAWSSGHTRASPTWPADSTKTAADFPEIETLVRRAITRLTKEIFHPGELVACD